MAPRPPDGAAVPDEEEAFLNDVAMFYNKRRVPFEREPKVGGRPIPLFKLFNLVMHHGGYDPLSAERMKWRSLLRHFGFPSSSEGTLTFSLKTTYLKNLAAYEIARYWGEEPPPPEILEHRSARGGDLRTRTLENYPLPGSRDSGVQHDGQDSGDEEQRTPKADAMDIDEHGSGARYPSRQLRQDPKRTQLFQPDLNPARQRYPRTTTSPQASSGPVLTYSSASADPRNAAFNIERYEPRQPFALTLQPVLTPRNNAEMFRHRQAMAKAQGMPRTPPGNQQLLRQSIPVGLGGPNIYNRCLYGLRSEIPEEQDFALHHLVVISFERGDKYKFDGFPFLAESLLEKVLEITELIYGVKWDVAYSDNEEGQSANTLDGSFGTPQLLQKLRSLPVKIGPTDPESRAFAHKLEKLKEAALVIRNMVTLEENAYFLSRLPLFRDFLIIAINLPSQPRLVEFRHYALEMAEQVTRFWDMEWDDPLCLSLMNLITSNDRGSILLALQAIVRIGMDNQAVHCLSNIPSDTIERCLSFVQMGGDDKLLLSSLDFLYQYTHRPENIRSPVLAAPGAVSRLTPRLVSLLLHGAIPIKDRIVATQVQELPKNDVIGVVPLSLGAQLNQYPEPERSSRWLKCCFEESPHDDITQIAIWQAYQPAVPNPMPAADFIKNVSNTFTNATAQVINGPTPRFIIKGIHPRRVLVDLHGNPLFQCRWTRDNPDLHDAAAHLAGKHLCLSWHQNQEMLWTHIIAGHLKAARNEDGSLSSPKEGDGGGFTCKWSGCLRQTPLANARDMSAHVRLHIPTAAEQAAKNSGIIRDAEYMQHMSYYTATDEHHHPAGIPWVAFMILLNLARYAQRNPNVSSDTHPQQPNNEDPLAPRRMHQWFGHVMGELWRVVAVQKTLSAQLGELMSIIQNGAGIGLLKSDRSSGADVPNDAAAAAAAGEGDGTAPA